MFPHRTSQLPGSWLMVFGSVALALSGCFGRQSRIAAPEWEPDKVADSAIADNDQDGDGKLSKEELAAVPGLRFCLKQLDIDNDGQLSRDEIYARIKLYKDMQVGLTNFSFAVTYNGRPLADAKVKLVPEPFLGVVVEPAEGTTTQGGQVQVAAVGADIPAARIGMYRVEITSPNVAIPAKYNTNTILGIEISPVTDPTHNGPVVFRLKG